MFELVVFIISVAIIYAYAANRFADFPEDAERANFQAVMTQLQSGVSLEFMLGMGRASRSLESFEGANPMDLMLNPPANYVGAFDAIDESSLPRRSWYFNKTTQELVYLVSSPDSVYFAQDGVEYPTDHLRFRLAIEYRYEDSRSGLPVEVIGGRESVPDEFLKRRVAGALISPVIPYIWGTSDADLLALAVSS